MQVNTQRFRTLKGPLRIIERIINVAIPLTGIFFILDIPLYFGVSFFNQQYLGLFLGLVMALLFLIYPPTPGSSKEKVPLYDLAFALISFLIGFYVFINYPELIATIGILTPFRVIMGAIFLVLIIEGVRRLAGWFLVIVVVLFIIYFRFGYLLPGALASGQIGWDRAIIQVFLGAGSVFGIALRVAATIVFPFILFAQVLFGTGGAEFLFKLSESLMGKFRGGPAKISILVSSLFGTLSGSAVANVAGTGLITIPLMKKTGYNPYYACAIEAVASTGGVIAPPIMGAAAFIIAEFLGVPYAQVVITALVPAFLYYVCLFIQVDLRAAKEGLKGLPPEQIPFLKNVLYGGWLYVIPFLVLIYLIFFRYYRPETSALYALLTLLVVCMFKSDTRSKLGSYMTFFQGTSRGLFEISLIGAAAGVVIGVVTYSGIGLTFSRLLTQMAGENLLILAMLTAIASIILGMGMPVTAAYLLLAVLIAPALTRLGVEPILAHLFIFYFGAFSFITPPIALASYVAASIGEADSLKTIYQSLKLALAGLAVPFIFLFNPAVTLIGSTIEIIRGVLLAILAVSVISVALEGFLMRKISPLHRGLLALIAIAFLFPLHWSIISVSGVLLIILLAYNIVPINYWRQSRKEDGFGG